MIPISPLSVKFTDEERGRIKSLAAILGWTESQIVRDSVAYTIYLAGHPKTRFEPKLISQARLLIGHEMDDRLMRIHIEKIRAFQLEQAATESKWAA